MLDFLRRLFAVGAPSPMLERTAPEVEMEATIIRECRAQFGDPPRSLHPADAQACRLSLTPEVAGLFEESRDPMLRILADQACLRVRGTVVWSTLVQANQLLFDPTNPHTLAANVLYSLDPYFDGRLALLSDMAHGLFGKKGSVPAERELREFVRVITDERARIMRRELPLGYCGGHVVYFATCFIQPGHLPGNRLTRPDFPLLVNFEETDAVMLLPSRFWSSRFVQMWG
jgi:hypothetical protein